MFLVCVLAVEADEHIRGDNIVNIDHRRTCTLTCQLPCPVQHLVLTSGCTFGQSAHLFRQQQSCKLTKAVDFSARDDTLIMFPSPWNEVLCIEVRNAYPKK